MLGLLVSLSISIIVSIGYAMLCNRMWEEYLRHRARWQLIDPCFRYGLSPLQLLSYRLGLTSCGLLLIWMVFFLHVVSYATQ